MEIRKWLSRLFKLIYTYIKQWIYPNRIWYKVLKWSLKGYNREFSFSQVRYHKLVKFKEQSQLNNLPIPAEREGGDCMLPFSVHTDQVWLSLVSLFDCKSTFMGYLIPKPWGKKTLILFYLDLEEGGEIKEFILFP